MFDPNNFPLSLMFFPKMARKKSSTYVRTFAYNYSYYISLNGSDHNLYIF